MTLVASQPTQLVLIKDLLDQARNCAKQDTQGSRLQSVLLFDLCVELLLSTIINDADVSDGNMSAPREEKWATLWRRAVGAIKSRSLPGLRHARTLARLHELRNLAQHNGSIPATEEIERYRRPCEEFLFAVYRDCYNLDLDSVTPSAFLSNQRLGAFVGDVQAAASSQPDWAIGGALLVYRWVLSALRAASSLFNEERYLTRSDATPGLQEALSHIGNRVRRVEDLALLADLGISASDVRRFHDCRKGIAITESLAGTVQMVNWGQIAEDELPSASSYCIEFVSKLARLAERERPGVLDEIVVPRTFAELRESSLR